MESLLPLIESSHIIRLSISPNEADIAITSINDFGTPGELNQYVLNEYGYLKSDLPKTTEISYGFATLEKKDKKPILFVVTVNGQNVSLNLESNLFKTLSEFRGWFRSKTLWIPLMGTGAGELSLEESYKITVNVINHFQKEFPTETTILLSIPNNIEGIKLFNKLGNSLNNELIDHLNFVKENNINFYLAGTIWNGENQIQRFYDKKIWEKGHDDSSYSDIILDIKQDDIIILKSTYASNGISYLRIKAIGIVRENLKDGATILVDWKIKDISIDIENLGYFRNTIQSIYMDEVEYILSKVDPLYLDIFLFPKIINIKEKIAGLISDSDDGIDYLEIEKDVNAFAKVIAAKSFEPPLAIALFGKWGSGKSFFMKKLKTKITDLSEINNTYCEGIAQIHFNAWSYMDSNLWASIVTRIFEELNSYINQNKKSDILKKEIEKELSSHLSIAKEEVDLLNNKKSILEQQIFNLHNKKNNLEREIDDNIKKIQQNTICDIIKNVNKEFNVKKEVIDSLEKNNSFINSKEELEKIIPEKYWDDPEKTYQIIRSKYTFLKEFFRKDKILSNILWLAFILVLIACIPFILELFTKKISGMSFLIPQATLSVLITCRVIWCRGEAIYKKLQPAIASFWKIKEKYEISINEAKAKFEQEEKVIKLIIEKNKSEILLISEQIQKTEILKTDLEFRISNALTTETLYSFIDKRSKSNDYKKHLGIISTIRKDFEILNDLFIGHNEEFNKTTNVELFKSKFKKPLERIILYIDDLDRCPEENVVQVLEAVNLLMAFPLFVVVVGVDSRWVKNALNKKYNTQFDDSNNLIEVLEVSNYLEKIFQIPFHLKVAEDSNVKDMIRNLAQYKIKKITDLAELLPINESVDVNNENVRENKSTQVIDTKESPTIKGNGIINNLNDPEDLILNDNEVELMQEMSEVVGNNPRCIKRFVNTFRVIKAHEEFNYPDDSNKEIIAILFLIALPLGKYKNLVKSFEKYMYENNNKMLYDYLKYDDSNLFNLKDNISELKHNLDVVLTDKKIYSILQETNFNIFIKHNGFIRRFTFSQL
ncbi:P-loop NTPase fold protein [Chryseobacterium limigenitum]|uniref:KAP family P-loop domain-containing protein n=1 Tax=Chryseobacterium limigenitum TaxID=1612149 RepID=A0A1K2IBM2_9FLAO|nr:P-loop NTPase fold protein [Chryseobacterium limigenitum]SFZ89704.1 KAP family P-loop domain-containing protein [Chryseobacterium limigenitum]